MKNILIRIPELGFQAGTTKWTAQQIESINNSLTVSTTKENEPCLIYKDKKTQKNVVLAFISNIEHDAEYYDTRHGVYCMHIYSNRFQCGIFNTLTPTAEKYVNDYLDAVCAEFAEKFKEG